MGKRYDQHSDMCGCERCALQWERENPGPVFDAVEDPNYCDYCNMEHDYCRCWEDPGDDYDDADDDDDGEYEDCGLMADGQCTKAGSEECDWSCGALHRAPHPETPPSQSEPQASAATARLDEPIPSTGATSEGGELS